MSAPLRDPSHDVPESDDDRRARLAWEAERIEAGLASAAAGRTVPFEAVKAWVDSWDTPGELPQPRSGK